MKPIKLLIAWLLALGICFSQISIPPLIIPSDIKAWSEPDAPLGDAPQAAISAEDTTGSYRIASIIPVVHGRSIEEIVAMAQALPHKGLNPFYTTRYATIPRFTAPYESGSLHTDDVADALNALKMVRYLAGVPFETTTFPDLLNSYSQHGAVLMAATNQFTHYPSQPADMDDAFYDLAWRGCGESNISAGTSNISHSILRFIQDPGANNIERAGHRRWMLMPEAETFGIGYAQYPGSSYSGYRISLHVFSNYDYWTDSDSYVAWPAAGNFPIQYLYANNYIGDWPVAPWSINLGAVYDSPSRDSAIVRLTRLRDQKTWVFNANTPQLNIDHYVTDSDHFAVDNGTYGMEKAIVFRPNLNELGNIQDGDTFTITVSGITKSDGTPTTLSYTINFFDLNKYLRNYIVNFDSKGGSEVASFTGSYKSLVPEPATPDKPGHTFLGWYRDMSFTIPWDFATDRLTDDLTLYANWQINTYTITFDSNDGSAVPSKIANYNTYISAPTAPTRTGYTFAGWYKDDTLTTAWNFSTMKVVSDLTLYAKWTPKSYTVTFNSNGGTAVASKSVPFESTFTAPANPTKVGFSFAGWFKDVGLTSAWDFAVDKVLGAMTLYAKWTPGEYTVTYNSNGGSAIDPVKAFYNTKLTAPTAPTREGYTFVGWYKDTALTSLWTFTTNVVTKDMTLYAKWKPIPYTVTFLSNSGTAVASKLVNYDAKIVAPTAPTRTGWTFIGWYKESDFATPWVFATDVVKGPTTLYAKWQIAVKFVSNGGTTVDPIYLDAAGQAKAPTAPTRTGYTFVGWYKDSDLTRPFDFATETVTASLTLYAKWQIKTYTVTFDSNGGSAVPSKTANYNTYITAPTAPTKTGYTFAGWYKDETLTTVWGFSSMKVVDPITLYAKWTRKSFTVTFNSNGGTAVASKSVPYESTLAAPTPPTKVGHTFAGWYRDVGLTTAWDFASDQVLGAMTLYAKWTPAEYTVTYNSNGGTAIAPVTALYNTKLTAPTPPTRDGYTFVGWYKDTALSSVWTFTTNVVTKDMTLYAKWKPIAYTVSFVSNGGTAVASKLVNYDAKITAPTNPTRTGYTFAGWFKDSDLSDDWAFASDIVKGPTTLYARWLVSPAANFAALAVSKTEIKLSWTTDPVAQGYEIYRATSSGGTYTKISGDATGGEYIDTGLTTGKTYYYKLRPWTMLGATKIFGAYTAIKSAKADVVTVTMFNSAMEHDAQLKAYAEYYRLTYGVDIQIINPTEQYPDQGALYAAGKMTDLFLYWNHDLFNSWGHLAADLSSEPWVNDTDYAYTVDGKVYGFPTSLKGCGLSYNADILEQAGIDPATLTNHAAYVAAFATLEEQKETLGIESVVALILSPEFDLNAYLSHGLAFGDRSILDDVNAQIADETRFGQLAAHTQLLIDYSGGIKSYDDAITAFDQGKAAFIIHGDWIEPTLTSTFERGIAPLGAFTAPTNGITVFVNHWYAVNNTSAATVQTEAKKFLARMVTTEAGQRYMVEDSKMVPAFDSVTLKPEPGTLPASVQSWVNSGKMYSRLIDDARVNWDKIYESYDALAAGTIDSALFAQRLTNLIAPPEPITIFSDKMGLDEQLIAYAEQYTRNTYAPVTVITPTEDYPDLQSLYAAGQMPDIFQITDPGQFDQFADTLADLNDESWVSETAYAFHSGGQTVGFPFGVEGLGLIYNADLLTQAGIDPATLTNAAAYQAAFATLESQKADLGIDAAVAMCTGVDAGMSWVTSHHNFNIYLSGGLAYTDTSVLDLMLQGEVNSDRLAEYADFVQLLFDYSDPAILVSGSYAEQIAAFSEGRTAFLHQGIWAEQAIGDVDFAMGFAPIAAFTVNTDGLTTFPTFWYGVNNNSIGSDEAKKFLDVLVHSDSGQSFLINDIGILPAFDSIPYTPAAGTLTASLKDWVDSGKVYALHIPKILSVDGSALLDTLGLIYENLARGTITLDDFIQQITTEIATRFAP